MKARNGQQGYGRRKGLPFVDGTIDTGVGAGCPKRGAGFRNVVAWLLIAAVMGPLARAEAPTLAERQAALLLSPPRKVVVATVCTFLGRKMTAGDRVAIIDRFLAEAAKQAEQQYPGTGLDLFVLPENALQRGSEAARSAGNRALSLEDKEVRQVGALAARESTWLILPMQLAEKLHGREVYRNAAVLFDRKGRVAGVYRKLHPLADKSGVFEGGVTPGEDAPVFVTDFGKVGIQICWDMSFEDGWAALGASGAELVAVPSASPQNIPLAWFAHRHRYWIVNSAPRDNVTIFNPIGLPDAQLTKPGVLVHRFDLVSAAIHWNPEVDEGRVFQRRFGDRVGFVWNAREDTGLFWSNDANLSIGAMMKELGQEQMDAQVERIRKALKAHKAH
ncbi:MAG: carbon-nitrogen hydrolase family protein [Opitutaceae bacterium]|nr:carbon-nitrogen hydrolase family protein [Opitutaceae bacterium]